MGRVQTTVLFEGLLFSFHVSHEYIFGKHYMAVDQNPVLSRGPTVTNPVWRISRGYDKTHYLKVTLGFFGFDAEGFVAEHPVCYIPMKRNGRPSLLQAQCL